MFYRVPEEATIAPHWEYISRRSCTPEGLGRQRGTSPYECSGCSAGVTNAINHWNSAQRNLQCITMNRYEQRRQRLIASLVTGRSVLDIGCAQLPNRYLRCERLVGLDISAMEVRPPYTEHVVGDANDISALLKDQRFDTVLLAEFIEHVERPYDLLRAVARHIAPNGRLVLSTPNPLGIPVVLVEYLSLRRFFYTDEHVFYFTPRWMWRLLERCGYTVVKTVGCGASLCGLWMPMPVTLSYTVIYVAELA